MQRVYCEKYAVTGKRAGEACCSLGKYSLKLLFFEKFANSESVSDKKFGRVVTYPLPPENSKI